MRVLSMRNFMTFTAMALGLAVGLLPGGTEPAPLEKALSLKAGEILEDLRYRVDIWLFTGAVDARVTLRRLEARRFRAEVNGRAQGILGVLSGQWQGAFSTEMLFSEGKFLPVVYREESQHRGKKNLKEYRFDYDRKVVELFKWDHGKKALTKRWQTVLTEPMYDFLSFYYNQRLMGLSFDQQGQNLKFSGIPYPKPEDIILSIGPETPQGRKIMVTLNNRIFENERNQVYALLDQDGVPTEAWTQVLRFGRIISKLVPGGKRLTSDELCRRVRAPISG